MSQPKHGLCAGAEASFASLPRIKTRGLPRSVDHSPRLHCVRTVEFGDTNEATMSDGSVITYFANHDCRRLLPCGMPLLWPALAWPSSPNFAKLCLASLVAGLS